MIELKNIYKDYNIIERKRGLKGIFKDIFSPNYKIINAIDNINLTILNNERIGIVGKNGSGKSTLIKILTGTLQPSRGEVLYNHKNINSISKNYKSIIGTFWGQRFQLSNDLALQESFEFLRFVYKVDRQKFETRLNYLVERFDLKEFLRIPLRELSLGQRVICEIAAIFLHSPKIIFLDEPTIGLDLEIKENFYDTIQDVCSNENIILILASHTVRDIEKLAKRIIVMSNGKNIVDYPINDFLKNFIENKKITIIFKSQPQKWFKDSLRNSVQLLSEGKNLVDFLVPVTTSWEEILSLIEDSSNIYDIKIAEEDFDDILLNIYKKQKKIS